MRIRSVIGLGLAIIMAKFLIPEVFNGGEGFVLSLFETLSAVLESGRESMSASPYVPMK